MLYGENPTNSSEQCRTLKKGSRKVKKNSKNGNNRKKQTQQQIVQFAKKKMPNPKIGTLCKGLLAWLATTEIYWNPALCY